MTALQRKLLRDLRAIRGQVITVSLVIAAGVASYVAFVGAWRSLVASRDRYYQEARFADVFAHLKRAPDDAAERLLRIPGVAQVERRIVEDLRLDLPELAEPAFGSVASYRAGGPLLNALHLRAGRFPERNRADEVVVHEAFARAHALAPGATVAAVLNGRRALLRVVGIALSPEYVIAISPHGGGADETSFGIFWMDESALEAAFRMEGYFNDIAIRLSPGANAEVVAEQVDRVLAQRGGIGARPRDRHPSNRALSAELDQLKVEATLTPAVFLAVAAFLVNVVLSRLIATQREQIAALKALGYSNAEVAFHFLELVAVVVVLGGIVGLTLGAFLGRALTDMYTRYFRFPSVLYTLDFASASTSFAVAALAAAGSLFSVREAASLPPAEGMRPPAPATYRKLLLDRIGLSNAVSQGARMIVRDTERAPLRVAFSAIGCGAGIAILVSVGFFGDAIDAFFFRQFQVIQREHIAVEFMKEVPLRAVHELASIDGVMRAEAVRSVPVRVRNGYLHYDTVVQGLGKDADLRRVVDENDRAVPLPDEGLLASPELARRLRLTLGDEVELDILDGTARKRRVRLVGWFDQVTTLMPVMERSALYRLLGEAPTATGAALAIDPAREEYVAGRLKQFPLVASAISLPRMVRIFEKQNTEILRAFTAILGLFAAAITVGVVYNNARVSLAIRSRDLATLRVLGYTRREVSFLLIGELSVGVLLGIPVGLFLGNVLAATFASGFDPEALCLKPIVSAQTRAFAVAVALVTAAASALLVRRRLDALDLVSVLKARD